QGSSLRQSIGQLAMEADPPCDRLPRKLHRLPLGREALLNDVDLRRVAGVGIVARSDQAIQASELPLFGLDLGHVLDDRIRWFADRLIEQVHKLELRRLPLLKKLRALAKVQPMF